MKKIKVYLQFPWKLFPDSPYYKYLIENPPKNIKFLNTNHQKGTIINSRKFFLSKEIKWKIRNFISLFRIPIINAHLTYSKENYDLIHCAHCLSQNKNKNWIADFEGKWQFYIGEKTPSLKKKVRKILLDKNCKKILAWTFKVKEEILKEFPEIGNKIKVVYPAIPSPKIKRKKHNKINLLFTARYFYGKGGLHALEAIDRLTKKYKEVYGIFISEIPKDIKEKYVSNSKIKFYGLLPLKKILKEIYPISDIYIYPGYRDSFGFQFVEAMSFGIPIITLNGFARKEIVQDKKEGFILNVPKGMKKSHMREHREDIVIDIVKTTEKLIKNKKLRNKMSKNCIKTVKSGRFSIKERNKKLERIYEEALENKPIKIYK